MGNGKGEDQAGGVRFGKYHIVRKHGAGAFGAVYEALLPGPMGFEKRVAIKRLHPQSSDTDLRLVQAMINEARIGGLLHHTNIVDIIEFGEVDGDYYLAMEFVDGPNLAEVVALCREQRVLLPRFATLDIALQICRGLQHAHELTDRDGTPLHLIHRDLKPTNIIVDRAGTAKILDFGIAKAASNLFNNTKTGFSKGTPRYMSPDQVNDDTVLLPRSDLFSLGAVLYELVMARPLFTADSSVALALQIISADITERIEEADTTFPGMGPILNKALQREGEKRYQSAAALAQDLRPLTQTFPQVAEMGDVIGRLLSSFERTGSRAIERSGDLAAEVASDLESDTVGFETPITPIEVPTPRSSGWGQFTAAFGTPADRGTSDSIEPTEPVEPPPSSTIPVPPPTGTTRPSRVARSPELTPAQPIDEPERPPRYGDGSDAGEARPGRRRWIVATLVVALALVAGVGVRIVVPPQAPSIPIVLGVDLDGPDDVIARWTLERTLVRLTYRIQERLDGGPRDQVALMDGVVGEDAAIRWLGVRSVDGQPFDARVREALLESAAEFAEVPTLDWSGGFSVRIGWLDSGAAITGWSSLDGGPMPDLERWSSRARREVARRALACVPSGFRGMGYRFRADLDLRYSEGRWTAGVRSIWPEYFKTTAAEIEGALASRGEMERCFEEVAFEGLPTELEGREFQVGLRAWGSEPVEFPNPENAAWHGNLITLAPQLDVEPMDTRILYSSARSQDLLEVVRVLDEAEEELEACDDGLLWAAGLFSAIGSLRLTFDSDGLWIRDWGFLEDPMARAVTPDSADRGRVDEAVVGCVQDVLLRQPWPEVERLILVELALVHGPPVPTEIHDDTPAREADMILAAHLMRTWRSVGSCLLRTDPEAQEPGPFYGVIDDAGTLLRLTPWTNREAHPELATCIAAETDGIRLPAPGRTVVIDPWGLGHPPVRVPLGTPSMDEIMSRLRTAGLLRLAKECYEAELRGQPDDVAESFRLDLRFVISASGRITDVGVQGDDPGYTDLADCLAESMASIRLPPMEDEQVVEVFPIRFGTQ